MSDHTKPWYKKFICLCDMTDDSEMVSPERSYSNSLDQQKMNYEWYKDRKPQLDIQGIPSQVDIKDYPLIAIDVINCKIPFPLQCYPVILYTDIQPGSSRFQNDPQLAYLESLIKKQNGLTYIIDIQSENILNYILTIIKAYKDNDYFINIQSTQSQFFKRAPSVFRESHQGYNLKSINQKLQEPVNNIDIVFSSRKVRFSNVQIPDKIIIIPFELLQVKTSSETQKFKLTNAQKTQVINQVVTYFESIENLILIFPINVPYQDLIQIAQIIVEIYVNNQVYRTPQNKIFCQLTLITGPMEKPLAQSMKFGFDEQMLSQVSTLLQEQLVYTYIHQPKLITLQDMNLVKYIVEGTDAHSLCDILINIQKFPKNKILKSDVKPFVEAFSPILDKSFQLKHLFHYFLQKWGKIVIKFYPQENLSHYDTIDLSKQIDTFMDIQPQTVNQLFNTQNQTLKKGMLEKQTLSKSNSVFQVMEAMSKNNSYPKCESFDFMMSNEFQDDNPFNLQNLDPRDSDPGWNDDDQRIDTEYGNMMVTEIEGKSISKPSSLRRFFTNIEFMKSDILTEQQKNQPFRNTAILRKQSD